MYMRIYISSGNICIYICRARACVCLCVRVCVRACVRACVCVCVCACVCVCQCCTSHVLQMSIWCT